MNLRAFILIILILVLGTANALSQVVGTSNGKVEFIGLEKWHPKMIQEKLGYDSPDSFHFCAADLKDKLKFADASVVVDREDGKKYTIITVVEPDRAQAIRYQHSPTGSVPVPDQWRDLIQLVEQKRVLNGLLDYGSTLKNAINIDKPLISGEETTWWKLLQQRKSKEDFQVAIKVLAEDKEFQKRVAAAIILTNFADNDAAWLALMAGVRNENNFVNTACMQSLITLTKYVPRQVDWSSASSGIYHILNGTNLFALPHVIETLLKTKISPKLAKTLLKNNGGRMLLAYLRAKHEREKSLAHRLLAQLSGKDFGFDDQRWSAWISSNT
jgi:hypothetical protein